uniref:Ig-like domain-containing protein n=1 Tax=Meloidogyne incognita TaxID=6306 RepID=A0A914KHH5_MELIC
MSDSTNIVIEKTTNPEEIEEDQKNGGNDEESILIKNGAKDGNMADVEDLERGEQGRVMRKDKEKNYGREEESRLISYEELKQYRKSPLWRALRFLLFGGVAVIFVALITVAVLIVMMSSKCEELPEGIGLVMPKEEQIPNVYPRQLTVLTGQEAIFHCEFPTGQVEWRRLDPHGLFAEFPSGVDKTENGQLKIPVADINHQGEFACQVKDESNTKNMNTPQVVRLSVLNSAIKENEGEKPAITTRNGREELPPLALKPRVDSYLMIASAGEPVHFRCWNCQFAECRTSHRLVWQKVNGSKNGENELLNSYGPLAIERDVQSVFMIFQEVRQTDAGIYECLDQGTGATSSQVHLQVEPPRTPVIIPMNQTVPGNTTALIHCTVPGRTDAKLSWRLENGVEAEELTGVRDDGRGLLRIEHVRAEHVRHGYVCWAMYPKRADKQALHAGPAKVYIIGGEEQRQGEAIEKEDHSTEEKLEENKEEKKEERSTKDIIPEVRTTPENKIVAGGQIENLDEVENTSKNPVEEIEEEGNKIEDKEEKKNDEANGENDGVSGELKEKDVEKMGENKEEKKKDEGNGEEKEVGDDEKKGDEKEESVRDDNEERAKVEEDGEEKKEEKVKEGKDEDEVKEEKTADEVTSEKIEDEAKKEKNEEVKEGEKGEDVVKERREEDNELKEEKKEDEVKEATKKEDNEEGNEATTKEVDEVIVKEKLKEIEDKAILKNELNVKADKDEIEEVETDKWNEESKRLEEKKEEAKEKTEETEEAKKEESSEEKKGMEEKQEVVKENKAEEKKEEVEEKKEERKNEGVKENKEEKKNRGVEEKKEEGIEDEKEKGEENKGVKEKEEEIEEEKKKVIEENKEGVEVKKENDKEDKKEHADEEKKEVGEEKEEVEEKKEVVDDKKDEKKEGVEEKREEISDDTLKETNEEKIEEVSNKEEKALEEKEKGVSEEEDEGKEKEPNEETDRKPEEEEKKKDDEVSGEATIQIERLVHSISATGSKTNETTNNEGRKEIEEKEVTKKEEDENKNKTASTNDFWQVLDALMGIMPI